jgi:hypothetical protein
VFPMKQRPPIESATQGGRDYATYRPAFSLLGLYGDQGEFR